MSEYRNPVPTVDVVVLQEFEGTVHDDRLLLVKRKNPPHGWALPGGFVNEGESLETAAVREIKEETGVSVTLFEQFFTYSLPDRDPRRHVMTTAFLGFSGDQPSAGDDAAEAKWFLFHDLPTEIAFDHRKIITDVKRFLDTGVRRALENED